MYTGNDFSKFLPKTSMSWKILYYYVSVQYHGGKNNMDFSRKNLVKLITKKYLCEGYQTKQMAGFWEVQK